MIGSRSIVKPQLQCHCGVRFEQQKNAVCKLARICGIVWLVELFPSEV